MRRKKILIGLLVAIILLSILAVVYLNKSKKLNINSDLVQDLYKKVNPSDDGGVLSLLYSNPDKLDNSYILAVGFKNYVDKQEGLVESIKETDLEASIKEIFGDIEIKHGDAPLLFDDYCSIRYDSDLKEYETFFGCGGDWHNFFYRKMVEVTENDNELIITEKSIYVNNDWGDDYDHINIYNNVVDKELIKTLGENDSMENIKIDDYLDKASTYKYKFEKIDGKYIFKGIELVK